MRQRRSLEEEDGGEGGKEEKEYEFSNSRQWGTLTPALEYESRAWQAMPQGVAQHTTKPPAAKQAGTRMTRKQTHANRAHKQAHPPKATEPPRSKQAITPTHTHTPAEAREHRAQDMAV